jgi:hypothetical protein
LGPPLLYKAGYTHVPSSEEPRRQPLCVSAAGHTQMTKVPMIFA